MNAILRYIYAIYTQWDIVNICYTAIVKSMFSILNAIYWSHTIYTMYSMHVQYATLKSVYAILNWRYTMLHICYTAVTHVCTALMSMYTCILNAYAIYWSHTCMHTYYCICYTEDYCMYKWYGVWNKHVWTSVCLKHLLILQAPSCMSKSGWKLIQCKFGLYMTAYKLTFSLRNDSLLVTVTMTMGVQ